MSATRRGRPVRNPWIPVGIVVAVMALVGVVAFAVAFPITESPSFCLTCHEMKPFHDAWRRGPHAAVSCMDCHVDRGLPAHAVHKFVALQEVVAHFSGQGRFPKGRAEIPVERCGYCHQGAKAPKDGLTGSKFTHRSHLEEVSCFRCHLRTGHSVTATALAAVGALDAGSAAKMRVVEVPPTAALLTKDGGTLPGHQPVVCRACHDMKTLDCAYCHSSRHDAALKGSAALALKSATKDCRLCHVAGRSWTFRHSVRTDCSACHQRPAGHRAGQCSACHRKAGVDWTFAHPGRTDCQACHKPPANHFGTGCVRCHRAGRSFHDPTFAHPATGEHSWRSFPCKSCHPSGFARASCTGCHGPGGGD
jgi:nitrate/TMAO reductase-like tetraheme cytochrome c subunit